MNKKSIQLLTALAAGACFTAASAMGQVVFIETFGTVSATTAYADHTFDNEGLSFTGTGDLRATTVSTGYDGASGGANVFLTTGGARSLVISGIDTTVFPAGALSLTFGALKSTVASDMTELTVSYSTDGVVFTDLSFSPQPTGSGTAIWRSVTITDSAMIPSSENLTLRWLNTAVSGPAFRLDDIALIPEPSTYAAIVGALFLGLVIYRRRAR